MSLPTDRRIGDADFRREREHRDKQHAENVRRLDEVERRIALLDDLHELIATLSSKIDAFRPDVFKKIATEYESREAVREYFRRFFSTGTRITATISAAIAGAAGLFAAFNWLLSHWK